MRSYCGGADDPEDDEDRQQRADERELGRRPRPVRAGVSSRRLRGGGSGRGRAAPARKTNVAPSIVVADDEEVQHVDRRPRRSTPAAGDRGGRGAGRSSRLLRRRGPSRARSGSREAGVAVDPPVPRELLALPARAARARSAAPRMGVCSMSRDRASPPRGGRPARQVRRGSRRCSSPGRARRRRRRSGRPRPQSRRRFTSRRSADRVVLLADLEGRRVRRSYGRLVVETRRPARARAAEAAPRCRSGGRPTRTRGRPRRGRRRDRASAGARPRASCTGSTCQYTSTKCIAKTQAPTHRQRRRGGA